MKLQVSNKLNSFSQQVLVSVGSNLLVICYDDYWNYL